MMQPDSFYVTITSDPTNEFPNNTNSHFKKRLPNMLQLIKPGWKVGMVSIVLPVVSNNVLLNTIPSIVDICDLEWTEMQPASSKRNNPVKRTLQIKKASISSALGTNLTSAQIMQYIVDNYDYEKLDKTKDDSSFFTLPNSQPNSLSGTSWVFEWKNNGDLLLNNQYTSLRQHVPGLVFHVFFAVKMGWLVQKNDGSYKLGPNLIPIHLPYPGGNTQTRPLFDLQSKWQTASLTHDLKQPWVIKDKVEFHLSSSVNWIFVMHDKPNTLVHVHSNVAQSTVVNDKVANRIADVVYKKEASEFIQIQPMLVRYIPIRTWFIDVIDITLLDHQDHLLELRGEETTITLHFTRDLPL